VGDAVVPIEIGAAGLLEVGDDFAEFGVDTGAVVALVVIFED
jgi:hypothetical protein